VILKEVLKSSSKPLTTFSSILYRSSFYAVSAYFIALSLEKLLMVAGAALNGYSITLDYREVIINADPSAWDQESVILIYLFPNIIQALIIVWLYIKLQKYMAKPGYRRIFTLWIIFFIAFRLLGMIPVHLYFKTGIYHAFNWLYMGFSVEVILAILAIILFFVASFQILKVIFFLNANYNSHNRLIGIPNVLYSSILIPVIFCCAIAAIFFIPGLPKDEMTGLIILSLPVIIIFLRIIIANPEFMPSRMKVEEIFSPLHLFIIMLAILVILRIILGIGISFN
jgi:hypothetical protein